MILGQVGLKYEFLVHKVNVKPSKKDSQIKYIFHLKVASCHIFSMGSVSQAWGSILKQICPCMRNG